MIVAGWNNGSPNNITGGGYGIRVTRKDRDKYFKREWRSAIVKIGEGNIAEINLSDSFWKNCIEIRNKRIGKWMLDNRLAPWRKGSPPKFNLERMDDKKFKLSHI